MRSQAWAVMVVKNTMFLEETQKSSKADGIGTFVSVIQAFEDTEILTVKACWDAPTDVDGIIIPAGMCLYVKAESVTISSGCGVIYYEMAS